MAPMLTHSKGTDKLPNSADKSDTETESWIQRCHLPNGTNSLNSVVKKSPSFPGKLSTSKRTKK